MTSLLSQLRKHMNGAVLDSVVYYGSDYGMNMGVAVRELECIAREIGTDDAYARFLYRQQVRELRLVSVRIADPEVFTMEDLAFWARGVANSEIAEHLSHEFLSRIPFLKEAAEEWCRSGSELETYAALLSLAKNGNQSAETVGKCILDSACRFPDSHLVAVSSVKVLYELGKKERQEQLRILSLLPSSPTSSSIRSEIEWMNEY